MAYLTIDQASASEREALALIRAEAWAKELSRVEFCERNKILYSHPFGTKRIQTLLLKNPEKKIVSSMDALQVKFFFKETETQKIVVREGFLIASVLTPIQHRRKGYASHLMKDFLSRQSLGIGVLYSDIGPKFYERYGFQKTKVQSRELVEPFVSTSIEPVPIELNDWIEKVNSVRKIRFETEKAAQLCLVPETEFWDWQIERYRYFSRLKGHPTIPAPFFEINTTSGPSYFCVVKNVLTQTADVLWFDSDCPESLPAIGRIAKDWGLGRIHFWSPKELGRPIHEECPMGWFQGASKPSPEGFYDPQLCDWW